MSQKTGKLIRRMAIANGKTKAEGRRLWQQMTQKQREWARRQYEKARAEKVV